MEKSDYIQHIYLYFFSFLVYKKISYRFSNFCLPEWTSNTNATAKIHATSFKQWEMGKYNLSSPLPSDQAYLNTIGRSNQQPYLSRKESTKSDK